MHKKLLSSKDRMEVISTGFSYSNYQLLVPYVLPYAAYVSIASLFDFLEPGINYIFRIVAVTSLLLWAWRWYVPLRGPGNLLTSVFVGMIFGIVGIVLWIALLNPFVEPERSPWDEFSFFARIAAATLLVPVFEELLMRCFVFRVAHQWFVEKKNNTENAFEKVVHEKTLNDFKPGEWSAFAIFFSTAVFMMGHSLVEWPAAFVYGVLIGILWIIRKDLISCIVAHATSNMALGAYVYASGRWEYW